MTPNFEEILLELSYRVPTGIVDLTNEEHLDELVIILEENRIYNSKAINALKEKVKTPAQISQKAILNKTVKNTDTKKDIKVSTALAYKDNKNAGPQAAYKQALALIKKNGYSEEDFDIVDDEKPEEPNLWADKKDEPKSTTPSTVKVTGAEKRLGKSDKSNEPLARNVNKSMSDLENAKAKLKPSVSKGLMSQKELDSVSEVTTKIINGEPLNSKDKQIADKFIRIKNNPKDASLYLLYPPFNSASHAKVSIGNYDKLVAYGKENGVRGTAENVDGVSDPNADKQKLPKKGMAGANVNKQVEDTQIKSDKKGFSFGETGSRVEKVREYSKNEKLKVIDKLVKRGISEEDATERVEIYATECERRNKICDFFSKSNNVKTLDWGAEPTTDKGRNTILKNVREKSVAQFEKFFKQANGGNLTPEEKKVLDYYNSIKSPYEYKNFDSLSKPLKQKIRDNFQNEMHTLMEMMVKTPSFRQGVPDFAEIIRFSAYVGQGYEAYLPADSTFQISDIIVFAPLDKLSDKDIVDRLSESPSLLIETMVFTGGFSEKFMEGGAPSGEERLRQSVFRNGNGSFKTQERLLNNMKVYSFTFRHKDKFIENNPRNREDWKKLPLEEQAKLLRKWEDEMNQMPDDKEIQSFQKQLDDTINDAVKAGIISADEVEKIRAQGKHQGELLVNKAKAKGAGNCLDKKNLEKYHNMLRLWTLMGAITEKINNNDLKYTLFKNSREEFDTKGNFKKNEIIDGVKVKPGMKWKYDPGIDATSSVSSIEKHKAVKNGPKGCKFLAMNNPNSAHIIPIK